jgi:pyruvate/2-oxoglutarate dehydrogenase complex dihydrolipoamide acyltransferase (E2) component
MPKNGMDMKEGVLIRWLVKTGDRVEKGDPIMEIETDKVTMDSESPATGVILALYYDEGATIPVLKTMGNIGSEGEQAPPAPADEMPGAMQDTSQDAAPVVNMQVIPPDMIQNVSQDAAPVVNTQVIPPDMIQNA